MLLLLLNLAAAGGGISGAGSITDGPGTIAGAGSVSIGGAGAASDGAETVAGSGSGPGGISGAGAVADGPGTIAGAGSVSIGGSGSAADGGETVVGNNEVPDVLTLDEVKQYLGVFSHDKDAALTRMIKRARLWVEDHTGIVLLQRQFEERLVPTMAGKVRLSKGPLVSVDSVEYLDSAGVAATFTPVAYAPSSTLIGNWPSLARNEAFKITYTAGQDINSLDERLEGAILALIEGEFSEGSAYPQRAIDAAEACCGQLRRMVT